MGSLFIREGSASPRCGCRGGTVSEDWDGISSRNDFRDLRPCLTRCVFFFFLGGGGPFTRRIKRELSTPDCNRVMRSKLGRIRDIPKASSACVPASTTPFYYCSTDGGGRRNQRHVAWAHRSDPRRATFPAS